MFTVCHFEVLCLQLACIYRQDCLSTFSVLKVTKYIKMSVLSINILTDIMKNTEYENEQIHTSSQSSWRILGFNCMCLNIVPITIHSSPAFNSQSFLTGTSSPAIKIMVVIKLHLKKIYRIYFNKRPGRQHG